MFRLDRQRWTRQNIALERPLARWPARLREVGSTYLHVLALGALVAAVAFATNLLSVPRLGTAGALF
jgi:glycosyltransferase Alg8